MYIYSTDYEFKHIYDLKRLKEYSDYAARDIERIKEVIQELRDYQMEIYKHVQEVLNTQFSRFVVIERSQNYTSKKITYSVYLDNRPMIEERQKGGNSVRGTHSEHKNFGGIERHLAKEYALTLAKKHNATIEQRRCKLI